ncbi:MAG: hypothetical protein LBI13_11115 [Streptococcaceae bacterium]|jgi:hypothetical protein|nr:hypothetical protein [Streptococcaceae bacterium]
MPWNQYVSKSGMATFSTYTAAGDPGSAAWYEYYAYYAEPTIEQKVVERYFTVDNGQLTPKPVSADTGGAGNFTIDRNTSKPKNWWDKAVQGTQNFFNGVGHAIGNGVNWLNENVVRPVDNFLNSAIGQYVGSALVGGLLAGATILAAPEETAVGGTLVLGDVLAGMGRSVLGKTIGDFLDGTIGTVKTDSGTINPETSPLPKAGGEAASTDIHQTNLDELPENVQRDYEGYSKNDWRGNYKGQEQGYNTGKIYKNRTQPPLPTEINGETAEYKEYDTGDLKENGARSSQRFVRDSKSGKIYYTNSHYNGNWVEIEP